MPTDKVKKPNTSITTSDSSKPVYSFPRPCLHCGDYVSIVPGFALEILTDKGEHKGVLPQVGQRVSAGIMVLGFRSSPETISILASRLHLSITSETIRVLTDDFSLFRSVTIRNRSVTA
jgi:hypothetical protein